MNANPVNNIAKAHAAPRCKARSKRTGVGCKAPAKRGHRVCRFHGAGGGAPRGPGHGHYKHGRYTCEAVAARRLYADLVASANETIRNIAGGAYD
ncbi:hypothetical protein EB235_08210 [Mesorhizobium loti R88b]|uniref:Uncharacterized protein n=1 Tax=Mesorhizobium loti R88b TaxID=935548 RepID=A0A6M7WHE5_RHILI|nr:hypothetical protein EB235_08210 [Mesorhizobium loti R88b]